MSKYRDLPYGVRLPAAFTENIQEFISTYVSPNFKITLASATSIHVVAGTANDQVAIGIEGLWRFITSTVTQGHPGGAAGTFDIYVTTGDNVFTGGDPEVDSTDYTFGLAIVPSGGTPVAAHYRLVGHLQWNGSAITSINQTIGPSQLSTSVYTATIGDGVATSYALTHNLNATDVFVRVREVNTPNSIVYPDVRITDANTVTIVFDSPPASLSYEVFIAAQLPIIAVTAHAGSHAPGASDAIDYTQVNLIGLDSGKPPPSAANRGLLYFARDTKKIYRSDGTTQVDVTPQTFVIATTIAGLGIAVDGKRGRLQLGASPFTFRDVVYSAALGKWVTDEERWDAGAAGPTSNGAYILGWGVPPNYQQLGRFYKTLVFKALTDAGLAPQIRSLLQLNSIGGGGAGTFAFTVDAEHADSGAGFTSFVSGLALGTLATLETLLDSGWLNLALPGTPKGFMRISTTATGTGVATGVQPQANHALRWIG